MKLLPKSIVNTEIASQRKQTIDEGLMIAKKVDTLRATLSSLEAQHQQFINGMQQELHSQVQPLIDEMARRKLEIESLELKRQALLAPLTKEWEEVNLKRKEVESKEQELDKERVVLKKDQDVLEARVVKEKQNTFKINTIRNEIAKVLQRQQENETKTKEILQSTQETSEKTIKELEERKQAILSRDAEVAVREREVGMEKERLEEEKKFISAEKVRLTTDRQILERAMNKYQVKNKK